MKLLRDLVQAQSHLALAVGCGVLVQQTTSGSLIDSLDSFLVSLIGLAAVAFDDSSIKILQLSLQCGLCGLVSSGLCLIDQNTLLCRLDIRQTKHLLRWVKFRHKSSVRECIVA